MGAVFWEVGVIVVERWVGKVGGVGVGVWIKLDG